MGLFGPPEYLKCCCGGNCRVPCCPGFNLSDTVLDNAGYGPGGLGCPDVAEHRGIEHDNGWRMSVTSISEMPEGLFDGTTVCAAFKTDASYSIPGLVGFFTVEAIVACVGNGSSYRAFVRYSASLTSSIPTGVWIETTAGWECPDCEELGADAEAYGYLYWDALVDCSVCNSSAYQYEPTEGCVPDSLYSIRYYFRGFGTCL